MLRLVGALALVCSACAGALHPPAAQPSEAAVHAAADVWFRTAARSGSGAAAFQRASQPFDSAIYGDLERLDPRGQIVVVWHARTHAQQALLHQLVDRFNATNPWRITVLPESLGGSGPLEAALREAVALGRVPTLAEAGATQTAELAASGALAPLDYYVLSPRWGYAPAALGDYAPAVLAGTYLPELGAHYGWPLERSTDVLFYNAEWLAELGYSAPPATWEELATVACAAAARPFSDAKGGGSPVGLAFVAEARSFVTLLHGQGGSVLSPDGSAYTFGSPEGQATLANLVDLVGRGCASAMDRAGARDAFGSGHALVVLEAVHRMPAYEQAVGRGAAFEWGITPPPRGTAEGRAVLTLYGPNVAVFRTTPEAQLAAWLFIRWMSEPQQHAQWVAASRRLPCRSAAVPHMSAAFAADPAYERAVRLLALASATEPAVVGYARCQPAIEAMLRNSLAGQDPQGELSIALNACHISLREARP